MALLSLSLSASTTKMASVCPTSVSTSLKSSSTSSSSNPLSLSPPLNCFNKTRTVVSTRGRRRSWIVGMAPEHQRITRRSPFEFPSEWKRPKAPGREADVVPEFSPMKTPLPPPLPEDDPPEKEPDEEFEEDDYEEDDE